MDCNQKRLELREQVGIETGYNDIWGNYHEPSAESVERALHALGVVASDEQLTSDQDDSVHVPPIVIVRHSACEVTIPIRVPTRCASMKYDWVIRTEMNAQASGVSHPETDSNGEPNLGRERLIHIPFASEGVELGYHQLSLIDEAGVIRAQLPFIVVPDGCYSADDGARTWGVSVQLYALRSEANWGIGDFGDLKQLVQFVGAKGGDFIGLSPLHALFPTDPSQRSPYSPSARSMVNALFISVPNVPEFRILQEQLPAAISAWESEAARLRMSEYVDYNSLFELKQRALRRLFQLFIEQYWSSSTARAEEFKQYILAGGDSLAKYAEHEALSRLFNSPEESWRSWNSWDQNFRRPSATINEIHSKITFDSYPAGFEQEWMFAMYLCWIGEVQLNEVRAVAKEQGMKIGLYLDLALGSNGSGSDAWRFQDLLAFGMSAGAPPDLLNVKGQVWGMPPYAPQKLRAAGYEPFLEALRANMKSAGALRIDHVMSLMRLFWIPDGMSGADGLYLRYNLDELIGLVALESQRNRCLVIGEDLGTVPERIRQVMQERGVLSYKVLIFMQGEHGEFLPPERYPPQALVTVSTHDLPTLNGFWSETDLMERNRLNLFSEFCTPESEWARRERERQSLVRAFSVAQDVGELDVHQLSERGVGYEASLSRAAHRFLLHTPCQLLSVQLEDILMQREQMNLPGTVDEHPNWKRKYGTPLEAFHTMPFFSDENMALFARVRGRA